MAKEYPIVCVYHHFFIHSPIQGHPGCLHILAIVDNAVMNKWVRMSPQVAFWVSLDKYPKVGLLGPSLSVVIAFVFICSVCLFCSLDSTFKQNHIASVFLCLTCFTQHNTLQFIHAAADGNNPFTSMAKQYSIVYMHHLLFILNPLMDTQAASTS
ncbi:hypothetical protein mRhiFer1_007928 [Rhinolophus ferrumequinum]|uniref:Uncharacterized protein n=1 Tax=Rhinolophus ferrumequinum TaxID=59479 RepID=A0A7J8AVQ4_RHIFE|nr:hypothetical protein mRhiFer1_007928 [Rhinolophus ferrumequinum]